jgi:hypothetical protein
MPAWQSRGQIAGIVVVGGDAAATPVRGASLTLTDVGGRNPPATATSDDDGRFAFAGLPAGTYDLSSTKPGFLKSSYGSTRPERAGTPIALGDGRQLTGLALGIWRGGVIAGTLTDAKDRPLPRAPVAARRLPFENGVRVLEKANVASVLTDDRGEYRLFGLPPGEYAVICTLGAVQSAAPAPSPSDATLGYTPTYFPGTAVASDLVPVSIGAGEERTGVNFAIQPVPVATVAGTIVAPDASPLASLQPRITLTAEAESSGLVFTRGALVGADGRFTFAGVPPGRFTVSALAAPRRLAADTPVTTGWWAETEITVDGHNVSGVGLTLQPCVTVSGRVVFEGTSAPPAAGSAVALKLTPVHGAQPVVDLRTVPSPDRTFSTTGAVPGEYLILASLIDGASPVRGWNLKSIVINGKDVTDVPVAIVAGSPVGDVVVSLTDRLTEVSGLLEDTNGRPAIGHSVIALVTDRAFWRPGSRRIQEVRPATDGRFTVTGLPPGEYALAAVTDVQPGELQDLAFLGRLLAMTPIRITLHEGEKKTQNLRLAGS